MNKLAIHEISSPLPLMGILAKGKMIKVVKNLSLSLSLSLSLYLLTAILLNVFVLFKREA
jgi:hypothetical protein